MAAGKGRKNTTPEQAKADAEKREALCRRCGGCCYEKVRFGEQVVITDIPCPFLDLATNLCTVYPERFRRQLRCSSADDSIRAGGLPGDCPYVGGLSNYPEPHLLAEHPEYERAIAALYPGAKRRAKK